MTDSPAAAGGRWQTSTALSRALEIARTEGPRGLWIKLAGELGYRRLTVFELPLTGSLETETGAPDLRVSELASGDRPGLENLAALNPAAPPDQAEARLTAGHRCFLAAEGEHTVAACWVSGSSVPLPYLGFDLPMATDEACTFETWTDPSVRGRGIGGALRVAVARQLAASKTRLLAMLYPENRSGIRMVEKLGYRPIGRVIALGPASHRRCLIRVERGRRRPGGEGG